MGQAILDLSKNYNVLNRKYAYNIRLLHTDTDSLIIEVSGIDYYSKMSFDKAYYDQSNYPLNSQFHDDSNQ